MELKRTEVNIEASKARSAVKFASLFSSLEQVKKEGNAFQRRVGKLNVYKSEKLGGLVFHEVADAPPPNVTTQSVEASGEEGPFYSA